MTLQSVSDYVIRFIAALFECTDGIFFKKKIVGCPLLIGKVMRLTWTNPNYKATNLL